MLAAGPAVATLSGGKLLRLVSEARVRSDPALAQLGPDPLAAGFDEAAAAARLARWEPTERVGAALLDQRLIAGIGNVIRIEALWQARVSPWRRIGALEAAEAAEVVSGQPRGSWRPRSARAAARSRSTVPSPAVPARAAAAAIESRGQGDDNRITYWCEGCQR